MTRVTLLDGGMGQELVHRSGAAPTPLWSTQVMRDRPGLVGEVHADYVRAGAVVHTTNTYAIHRDRLLRAGIEEQFEALHGLALSEAEQAVPRTCRIAGSIGPLGASYRSDLSPPHPEAVRLYAEVARLLAPRVDLILFETVASLDQVRAVLEAGAEQDKPIWLALTVDDENGSCLRSGEALSEVLPMLSGRAEAVLANCSAPEAMPAALDILRHSNLRFGAYANGFTRITKDFLKDAPTVDVLAARNDMGPGTYADHVMSWVESGATIVGGCCETGPAHIAEIARRLRAHGCEIS